MLERPELILERQLDRAWASHDPERNRIPYSIWRRLHALKREFEPTASKIRELLADEALLRQLVEQCCNRRGMARQRILANVRRSFPGAQIKIAHKDILEISWMAPSPPVIANPKNPAEQQQCLLVCYCAAWPTPFGIRLSSAWSLEVPDHAAGRFLQRAGDANFRSALFSAANHFYGSDMNAVQPHVGMNSDIYLPAGGGCFVCTVIGAKSGTNNFLYARAATWIDETMLRPDQQPLPPATDPKNSIAAMLLLE